MQNNLIRRRREVGCKRAPFPPRGVVPSSEMLPSLSSSSPSLSSSAPSREISEQYLHKLRSRGLSEEMIATLSEGYLRLTPEWVAWSKPWASLHLRGNAFFTSASLSPAAPHLTSSVTNTIPANSTSKDKPVNSPDNSTSTGSIINKNNNKKECSKSTINAKGTSATTTVLLSASASGKAASGILSNTSKCASP